MQAIAQIAVSVYLPILAATMAGFLLSLVLQRRTSQTVTNPLQRRIPDLLARGLYLFGIPIGVANFIRKAELNASVWLSPLVAWIAVVVAITLGVLLLRSSKRNNSTETKTSYLLLSYLGNTSYLGFPVVLLLEPLGAKYFSSAVLYDILGTLVAGYGLGVFIAKTANLRADRRRALSCASLSEGVSGAGVTPTNADATEGFRERSGGGIGLEALLEITKNPIFYAFFIGLYLKQFDISETAATLLNGIAWASIMLALLVMGMRAQQLGSGGDLRLAIQPVAIKTILVPLIIACALTVIGIDGPQRLVLVLQAGMPCAFASLVLAENYDLDLKLTVSSILLSCLVFAVMLPIWVLMFDTW